MTRWFLGSAPFLATLLAPLLAGGCQVAQTPKTITVPPVSSNRPADLERTKPPPETLPATLPPLEGPTNVERTSHKSVKWDTKPPAQVPEVRRVVQPVDAQPGPRPGEPPPKHPIVLALECMLENRPQEAQYHLRSYDARTQEFLLRALPPLSLVSQKTLTSADVAMIRDQLKLLNVTFMERYSEFALPKTCFCDWIKGYAIYRPLPPEHEFVASLPDRPGEQVQLYIELSNFGSQPMQGLFETRLSSHVEICDEQGAVKWSHRFRSDDLTLLSRTRLSEYYHNFTFTLPASLPPGSYVLVVSMTDETQPSAPRTARNTLPLRIKAPRE